MVRSCVRPALILFVLVALAGCTTKRNTSTAGAHLPAGASSAVASIPAAPVTTPQQLAAEPGGLETVRIAFNLLMDKYYKPPKSNDLLQAAWSGVVQQLGGAANAGPALSGNRTADFQSFSDSFNRVASRGDVASVAFAAVNAMVRSLGDDHTYFLNQQEYKARQQDFQASGSQPVFSAKMLSGGIGYLHLTIFPPGYQRLPDGKTLAQELDATMSSFEGQGVKGWVLDLRDDPGGHTESIATLAGRFIPNGVLAVSIDSKQQRMELPVDGHYFPQHHPLAVLINGGSGSASEITAAALKDYGAGRLFGTRTAGSVNGAEDFPLPGQVGIQYTVVQVLAGKTLQPLDGVGVEPDQTVTGSDQQLAAAEAWLKGAGSTAPAVAGTPVPATGVLPATQIRGQLAAYGAKTSDIPPLPNLREVGDEVVDTPDEYAECAPSVQQLTQTVLQRGWEGEFDQFFGSGDPFTYSVSIDEYKDASGAEQAIQTNDFPTEFQNVSLPVRIGDQTVAQKGVVASLGETRLQWRRGRLVFSALYYSEPGIESFDPLVQIARAVDARYQQNPFK
jgi:C-terminal processing protease CtpA/Prc